MKSSLNHIFRAIWSDALNTWVAVSELTSANGKRSKFCVLSAAALAGNDGETSNFARRNKKLRLKPLVLTLACCFSLHAQANPVGAQVVSGTASINQSGNLLTVTNTPNAIINWQGFSIGSSETTRFIQQSASSSILNRVIGPDPSSLLGTLTSNGRVFLINPAGILVGQGARIDVPGFVGSTLNLSNADFLAGNLNFTANPNAGTIQNSGTITTPEGGSVYLVAPQVTNNGIINTPKGETILAAGNTVQLVDTGTPGVSVQITGSNNTATNLGQILADSGRIGMVGAVVNNSGTISANSLVSQGGKVFLKATQSATLNATGKIDVSGTIGGTAEVLGNQVAVLGQINASGTNDGGTVLVGGDAHGANPLIQNAQDTFVGNNATINANATQNGSGGKVVVWADVITQFNGNISAQGGTQSGNGGWVETSGRQTLGFAGLVNTTAAHGVTGTLLLDPTDITIGSTSAPTMTYTTLLTGTGAFADLTTTPSNLSATILGTQLATSNVIVDTTSSQNGTGSISVQNAISWNSAYGMILNATGAGSIVTSSGATITNSGAGGLTLQTASGAITLYAAIQTGGLVSLTGTGITNNASITGTGGVILSAGTGQLSNATANSIITNGGGTHTGSIALFADTMALAGGHINGGAGVVYINNFSPTQTISLGGTPASGVLNLLGSDLQSISTTGGLAVGNNGFAFGSYLANSTPTLTVAGPITTTNLAGLPTGASLYLTASGTLAINAALAASAQIFLDSNTASITESGGTISTPILITQSVMGQTLTGTNTVGSFNAINISSGSILLNNSTSLTVTGITAGGGNINVNNSAGDINVTGIIANGGNSTSSITLTAGTGSNLNISNTVNAGSGTVYLTSTGAIVGNTIGAPDVSAGTLVASSAAGIGLATSVGTINLQNTASGNIVVTNTDTGSGLTVSDVAGVSNGNGINSHLWGIYNAATGGQVNLINNGSVFIGDTNLSWGILADGNVAVTANGATSNISTFSTTGVTGIQSNSGNITLIAGQDVLLGDNLSGSNSNYGDVYASTGISINAGRNVILDNYSFVETTNNNIDVIAAQNISLLATSIDGAHFSDNGTGNVTLTAGGAININSYGTTNPGSGGVFSTTGNISLIAHSTNSSAINIADSITPTSGTVTLNASGTITESGTGLISTTGLLSTSSIGGTTLTSSSNSIGSFSATDTGAVSLTNSATTLNLGVIKSAGLTVTNIGAVAVNGVIAAGGGAVNLTATGTSGSIIDGGSGLINAGSVQLTAATGIGSTSSALQLATSNLTSASTSSGGINISNTPAAAVTLGSLTTGDASAVTYKQNGQNLTLTGLISSAGGNVLIDPPTNLTMSSTALVNSGGGAIGVQSLGNVVLSSINAGSGAINLNAGGSISAVSPYGGGPNLIGGTATLTAGGNANFSAQVQTLIATGVLGSYTIKDASGAVLFSGSGTAPAVVQQLVTTVLPQTNPSGNLPGNSIISLITNNVLIGGTVDSGLLNLLYAPGATIGGTAGSFGGNDNGGGTSSGGTGTSNLGGGIDNSKGKQNAKPNKC